METPTLEERVVALEEEAGELRAELNEMRTALRAAAAAFAVGQWPALPTNDS